MTTLSGGVRGRDERGVCQSVFDASCMSESAAEGLGQHTVSTACCQSQKGFP